MRLRNACPLFVLLILVASAAGAQEQDSKEAGKARRARINELRKQIQEPDEAVRLQGIQELGGIVDEDARSLLSAKMRADTENVRIAAAKAIVRQKKPYCAQALGGALQANGKNERVVKALIEALAELDMCASIPVLLTVLQGRYASGGDVLEALVKIGCFEAVPPLIAFLKSAEKEEKKPDFIENVGYAGGAGAQPLGTPVATRIPNWTKDKVLAALAPRVRDALGKLTGKSHPDHRAWSAALAGGELTPKLVSIYLCEGTQENYEILPGKSKQCPNKGDGKPAHQDTFLKHRRE